MFYVWSKCELQITDYSCCCVAHLEELKRLGHVIYQVTEIATQKVVFLNGVDV